MTPDVWLLLTAVVVLLLVAWVAWTLTRLGRLEARVERAWTALDTQLQRRAALAEELCRDHAAVVVTPATRQNASRFTGRPQIFPILSARSDVA